MAQQRSHHSEPHYFVAGCVLIAVLVVGALISLYSFRGGFDDTRTLTVRSDRSGLVMQPGAKVKMHGVTIGSVSKVNTDGDVATLTLRIDEKSFGMIPAGSKAQIKASTAFGSKYVALLPQGQGAISAGATITSVNVATEVNTLFENLLGVMQAVDPAKLNATLGAVAGGLRERGGTLGETIGYSDAVLRGINPLWRQIARDTTLTTKVTGTYNDAADNILDLLDDATVTATTVRDNEKNLDGLLASAIGLGNSGTNLLRASGSRFVNASRLLVPTTQLLAKYSPEYKCVADQATYNLDYGMGRFGGKNNGYSLDLDVALLLGDNAYRYPDNLPKVNATGGPKGSPGCYSQITRTNYPAPYLVMDTGASNAYASELKAGTPAFIQYMVSSITSGGGR